MDDRELLKAYAQDRSEAAFAELVLRHLAWVYSVALRHLGNEALAEDVAQSVFLLLAQKAGSLRSGTLVGGWLFRTTRFVANRALRAERRRRSREEIAAFMQYTTLPDENDDVWKNLEPYIDQAVACLSEPDRAAILLRFYEKRPLEEIGRHLGTSEEAAKKRVSRALQKLRGALARRGVSVGLTLLVGLMTERTVQAIPAKLATSVLKTTTSGLAGSGFGSQLVRETLNAWRWTRCKLAAGVAVSTCGLAWLFVALVYNPHPVPNSTGSDAAAHPIAAQESKAAVPSPNSQKKLSERRKERVMHFRVIAKDSGEPVSGAPLAVNTVTGEGWKQWFDLSTDENGSADVTYPPATGRLDIGLIASGWAARFVTWQVDSDPAIPADYTLRVDRMTNFMAGWLRDENGQAVVDAVVEVDFGVSDMAQEENPRERTGFVCPAPVARSDQRGYWSCALVRPDAKRFPGFHALHPDFASTKIMSASSGYRDDAQAQAVNLLWGGKLVTVMNRGVSLVGRITTEDGQPIEGALIEHDPSSFGVIRAEADTLGRFTIPGLPPGPFDFIVTAPGFAQSYVNTSLQAGAGPMDVRLKPGAILRLRLVDEDGNAVANAKVALTGPGGVYVPGMNWSADTGPDGRVEWTSAPSDRMLNICAFKRPDFSTSRGTVVKADGEEHIIALRHMFVVSGRVSDARSGELVQGEIKAFPGYGEGENSWFRGEMRRTTDGTFKVYFDEERGPRRFRMEVEGYSPFISDWLRQDSTSVVDVSLQPGDPSKTARGIILRTDGQQAAGAQVALLSPEHSALLGRACFSQVATTDRLVTNADEKGKFAFPEEQNAAFVVAVCSNGFARAPVRDTKAVMEIRLQPWGRLEGHIEASALNRPVAGVTVDDLLALDSPGSLRLDSQVFHSKPAEDGRFSFEFLPAGSLCVWLDAGVIEDPKVPPYHHPAWIQVVPGETAQVKIMETGCRVKGHFVLSGREDYAFNKSYAVLETDWPFDSAIQVGRNARQWMGSFFDLGRLIIAPNGGFGSRNAISPGTYQLLGELDDIKLDQQIEVPNAGNDSLTSGNQLESSETAVVDLGDVVIIPKTAPK